MPSHADINAALRAAKSADVHGPVSAAAWLRSVLPSDPGVPLTQAGDTLQSSASRLAEWVLEQTTDRDVPYEVHEAALEALTAVDQWTEARRI